MVGTMVGADTGTDGIWAAGTALGMTGGSASTMTGTALGAARGITAGMVAGTAGMIRGTMILSITAMGIITIIIHTGDTMADRIILQAMAQEMPECLPAMPIWPDVQPSTAASRQAEEQDILDGVITGLPQALQQIQAAVRVTACG